MKLDKASLLLYAVTDRSWLGSKSLADQVAKALDGGVTCIQLREKDLSEDILLQEAKKIKGLCQKYNVPFIINDHVDIAIKCQADGIHIGQHDMNSSDVRSLIGNNMILGVSVHTVDQAVMAEKNGADYLGVGAVFPTSTKDDADMVTGETLKAICDSISIPVVAIGGITGDNMASLAGSGIAGVALVSAIFAQPDITKSCKELIRLAKSVAF